MTRLSLLEKKVPTNIAALIEPVVKVQLSQHHPLLTLLQQMGESADPANYALALIQKPPANGLPKSVLLSQGIDDSYTPNSTTVALAAAIGMPLVGERLAPTETLSLRGLQTSNLPVAGNVDAAAGMTVTAGLIQLQSPPSTFVARHATTAPPAMRAMATDAAVLMAISCCSTPRLVAAATRAFWRH